MHACGLSCGEVQPTVCGMFNAFYREELDLYRLNFALLTLTPDAITEQPLQIFNNQTAS